MYYDVTTTQRADSRAGVSIPLPCVSNLSTRTTLACRNRGAKERDVTPASPHQARNRRRLPDEAGHRNDLDATRKHRTELMGIVANGHDVIEMHVAVRPFRPFAGGFRACLFYDANRVGIRPVRFNSGRIRFDHVTFEVTNPALGHLDATRNSRCIETRLPTSVVSYVRAYYSQKEHSPYQIQQPRRRDVEGTRLLPSFSPSFLVCFPSSTWPFVWCQWSQIRLPRPE